MIKLHRVSFAYGDKPIVTDLSLTISADRPVCLFGNSGCGKTTLLRLIAGLDVPQSGTVSLPSEARIATVFQDDRLLPWLTVRQNIEFVLPSPDPSLVQECLAAVELSDDADRYPRELSGGMKRRVALARALAYGGDILLLDEPFNGLDLGLKQRIAAQLQKRFADCPIVLVTHFEEEAALLGADIVYL